ncbi:hypothetical protein PSBY109024_18350 [Pseudoalteromonas byunsanensis]
MMFSSSLQSEGDYVPTEELPNSQLFHKFPAAKTHFKKQYSDSTTMSYNSLKGTKIDTSDLFRSLSQRPKTFH